jgi:hypothetical protein
MIGALRSYNVPGVPLSLNEYTRLHWAKQKRAREEFQTMLWAVFNEKGNRAPRGLQAIDVRAVITFDTDRGRDSDNYGSVLAKWTQDVLVSLGVIPDDTADRCTFYPPVLCVGAEPSTFIVISERAQGANMAARAPESLQDAIPGSTVVSTTSARKRASGRRR